MKSARDSRTLTITLSGDAEGSARSVKLNRVQTELALIGIPATILWGLAATAILLHNAWTESKSTPPSAAANSHISDESTPPAEHPAPQVAGPSQPKEMAGSKQSVSPDQLTARSKAQIEKGPAQPRLTKTGRKRVQVGDVFQVQASLVLNESGPLPTLQLEINNQSGDLEAGKLWARVKAVDEADQTMEFLSSPGLRLTPDGRAGNPSAGSRYAIRHQRVRTLELFGPKGKIKRFTSIQIGISQDPDGSQSIGSADF